VHADLCSVAQRSRLIPLFVSANNNEARKQFLYPDGDPNCYQNLIVCSTFPENFMQIREEVFAQSCYQTDKQSNNDENISSLAEIMTAQKHDAVSLRQLSVFLVDAERISY